MVKVVVANFVGSVVTVPFRVTVYIPIWLSASLYIRNWLFVVSRLKTVSDVGPVIVAAYVFSHSVRSPTVAETVSVKSA